MPEVSIPGMAFRARLTNRKGRSVVELIFRGDVVSSIDIGEKLSEATIQGGLKAACKDADIEHQVPSALLGQVAGDLYKQGGIGEGKVLVPQEFEVGGDASVIDKRLAIIISSLQKIDKRLDKIETLLEFKPQE